MNEQLLCKLQALVLDGRNSPNGLTEFILHEARRKVKVTRVLENYCAWATMMPLPVAFENTLPIFGLTRKVGCSRSLPGRDLEAIPNGLGFQRRACPPSFAFQAAVQALP